MSKSLQFVNRTKELERLESWWREPRANLGLVWGRRRVGKTALLQEFSQGKKVVFHTGSSRPLADELATISRLARDVVDVGLRDLETRPFSSWPDCLETLAEGAREQPLLLILDEFPELLRSESALESILRSFWDQHRSKTKLSLLFCGSAVRVMNQIQEERAPLYGRIDLNLRLDPFEPHEVAGMLKGLRAADRALVWGLVGGIPLYLEWWDQKVSIRKNLERLVCTPGGRLLVEGDLVLATEGGSGDLARQILHAVAAGRTRYNEIEQAVGTSPARVLENLIELRLVQRFEPVTESQKRTRRKSYKIADNFLAFWLGVISRYRAEIDRGLGKSILPVLLKELDGFMGGRWEIAFRQHLRRLATEGRLVKEIVAVGPFWTDGGESVEIDAVALAGRGREAVLLGEAKWSRSVNGKAIRAQLERKAAKLPRMSDEVTYAVCARERVEREEGVLAITAGDVFGN